MENYYFSLDEESDRSLKGRVKHLYNQCRRINYSVLEKIYVPHEQVKKKYQVAVLSIFKNEAQYFKEWIEYHQIVGVQHFYLYNNNSEDNYQEVLQPYIEQGIVTLLQWQKNYAQMECYADGIKRFKDSTEWIGIIDIDEFVVPNTCNTIYEFLKDFSNRPAVLMYWKMFGTSGIINRDENSLVTECFTVGWNKYSDIGKCFYNTKFDFDPDYKGNNILHHFLWGKCKNKNLPPVNVFNKVCMPGVNPVKKHTQVDHFPIQINHYFTKSYDEYLKKKSKGDVYFEVNPHDMEYFYEHEMKSCRTDHHIFKYLIQLKRAMVKGDKVNGK